MQDGAPTGLTTPPIGLTRNTHPAQRSTAASRRTATEQINGSIIGCSMTLNRYLRYFVIGGLFLIPLVPLLVFTSQYFPFVTSKNFAFRIIVELIFGAWLILALRDANYRPKFSWLSGAVLIFLVAIGVADLFGPFPDKSFWSNFRRMEGYITILHLGAYFLVAASTLISENLWILFMQTALGSSVVMGIYAVPQLLEKFAVNQGEFRLTGRLGNAAFLAVYALLHLFIALFLLVRRRNLRRWNIIYGLIASLELVILYHTATRSTMLGLFIGLFIAGLSVALLTKGFNGLKKTAIGVMAALILAVVGWALLKDSSFVKQNPTLARLTSLSLAEVGPRKIVWDIAIKGFEERPNFGWGQENFNHVFNKYFDPATDPADQWYVENRWSDRAHNIFLDWLIAGGLVGLLSYLFIFLSALYYIWQQNECGLSCNALIKRLCTFWKPGATFHCLPEKSILTGMLGAYLFQNVFMFDNLASYIIFFTILAYIHSMSGRPIKALTEEKITISAGTINRVVAPALALLTVFSVYALNAKAIHASTTLRSALRQQPKRPAESLTYFKQALSYDSFGGQEIQEELAQAALQVIQNPSIDIQLKKEYHDFIVGELHK
ncbi:MAG: O-antigen ligase family protein, partial [candidate division NC10 bacterium]|nr:O-antigen ligase family protein [candidate division NC10 bacterium]